MNSILSQKSFHCCILMLELYRVSN